MRNDTVFVGRMKVDGSSERVLYVRAYYSLGGASAWSAANNPRGYYLSVTPTEIEETHGVRLMKFCPFDGLKTFLKGVTRRSTKGDIAATADAMNALEELVGKVCAKNGIDRGTVSDLVLE